MDSLAITGSRSTGVQTLDRAVAASSTPSRESGPCTLADLVRETGSAAADRPPARGRARSATACSAATRAAASALGGRLVGWGAAAGRGLALVEPAGRCSSA